MNRDTMTKVFSTTLSLALMISSVPMPAHADGPMGPAFVAGLTPPTHLGYVASSFAPNNESQPRLIVIADLHGQMDVQKNIMGMLEFFTQELKAQPVTPIFLEGGWKPHLEEPLRDVQNPKARAILADYLLNKAELAAGQAFSERHPGAKNFTLTGVENQAEYEANRERFAETYPMRKVILQAIVRQERTIRSLENSLETSGFEKYRGMREAYLQGQLPLNKYVRILQREAASLGIHNGFTEILKNSDQASEGDVEVALTEVNRQVLQAISESRPVSSYLRPSLPNETLLRKNLALIEGNLDLLKRVVGEQLTPDEVALAYVKLPQLTEVAQILLADEKIPFDLGQALRKSLEFYPYAMMRNETLAVNSLAALDKDPSHPQTGVLIAGGFHAESIAEYLREHRIAYMVVDPTVNRDITAEEQLNYVKRVCLEHVTAQEMKFDLTRPESASMMKNPLALPVDTLPGPAANQGDGGKSGSNGFSLAVAPGIADVATAALLAEGVSSVAKTATVLAATQLTRQANGDFNAGTTFTAAALVADQINEIREALKDDLVINKIDVEIVQNGTLVENDKKVEARVEWNGAYGKIQIQESAVGDETVLSHEVTHLLNPDARHDEAKGEVPTLLRGVAVNAAYKALKQAGDTAATAGVTLATVIPVSIAQVELERLGTRNSPELANGVYESLYANVMAELARTDSITFGNFLKLLAVSYLAGPDTGNEDIQKAIQRIAAETGATEYMTAEAVGEVTTGSLFGSNALTPAKEDKVRKNLLQRMKDLAQFGRKA